MRNILFLMCLALWSCTSQSQSLNTEINEVGTKPYLLGKINKEGLTSENYSSWFVTGFEEYQPNPETIDKISNQLKNYNISLFMGTWCGDSRREVPRFYKVLEAANYPMEQLSVIAVSSKPDMYKQSPNHEEKGLNIHRVPTFIFYKNGKEVNRIVEHPVKTLEDDVSDIVGGEYTPNYSVVDLVHTDINEEDFMIKAVNKMKLYKSKAKDMYALNTYSRVLESKGKKEKALDVLRLNTMLFPENLKAVISLGNFCLRNNKRNEALEHYEKAVKMNPKNSRLKMRLSQLKSELSSTNN